MEDPRDYPTTGDYAFAMASTARERLEVLERQLRDVVAICKDIHERLKKLEEKP